MRRAHTQLRSAGELQLDNSVQGQCSRNAKEPSRNAKEMKSNVKKCPGNMKKCSGNVKELKSNVIIDKVTMEIGR